MSYDLYFFEPAGRSIDRTALREYFAERPHYTIQEQQARYENKDTGVYFYFDLKQAGPAEMHPDADGMRGLAGIVAFNLAYFRPHIFGLEAEPEVSAFVQAFNLGIHDPQIFAEAGERPYSRELFLRSWNMGNEFSYKAMIDQSGRSAVQHSLPGEAIERYWQWNYARPALQASLGEDVFVPPIMFVLYQQRLLATAVWTDAIPIALPRVDLFTIVRRDLAPRRLFLAEPDLTVATFDEVELLVAQYPLRDGSLPFRLLNYSDAPSQIVDWVRGLPNHNWVLGPRSAKGKPQLVPVDAILNSEIVARFAGA